MTAHLRSSAQRIQDILKNHNLTTSVVEFADTTRTCQDAARVIGCDVAQIAKALIFKGKQTQQPFCIIASGKNRVDEKKVEQHLGQVVEKPDAAYVLKHTGFAIGGIPPIGYQFDIKPFIDEDLMNYQQLWAAAGTPHTVFTFLLKI